MVGEHWIINIKNKTYVSIDHEERRYDLDETMYPHLKEASWMDIYQYPISGLTENQIHFFRCQGDLPRYSVTLLVDPGVHKAADVAKAKRWLKKSMPIHEIFVIRARRFCEK